MTRFPRAGIWRGQRKQCFDPHVASFAPRPRERRRTLTDEGSWRRRRRGGWWGVAALLSPGYQKKRDTVPASSLVHLQGDEPRGDVQSCASVRRLQGRQ